MRIHRVFCKSVSKSEKKFNLDNIQSHHLIKALRLKEGDKVEVFDGEGITSICKILKISKKECSLERLGTQIKQKLPKRKLSVVVPFIKKNNFNFMLQKLAEIGVNTFIVYKPDLLDQSVSKNDFKKFLKKSLDILIAVCKQCGNNFIPKIYQCESLEIALNAINKGDDKYIFDTEAIKYFTQEDLDKESSVSIVTGPESGFSEKEIAIINNKEIKLRYLGKNILRSETAPIYVSSLVKNHFGKMQR